MSHVSDVDVCAGLNAVQLVGSETGRDVAR